MVCLDCDRTVEDSASGGNHYSNDDAVRVNMYGAAGTTSFERSQAYDSVRRLLADLYNRGYIGGYSVYNYHTDRSIGWSSDTSTADKLRELYDVLDACCWTDDVFHFWVYNDDVSPSQTSIGFDISCSGVIEADKREPWITHGDITNSCGQNNHNTMLGFAYYNENEEDLTKEAQYSTAAHEVAHGLVRAQSAEEYLPDDDPCNAGNKEHYLGDRIFDDVDDKYRSTVMAFGQNCFMDNGGEQGCDCNCDESDYDRVAPLPSDCLGKGIEDTITWAKNNV